MLGVTFTSVKVDIPVISKADYKWYALSFAFFIFVLFLAFCCINKVSHASLLPLDMLNDRMRDILDAETLIDL